MTVDYLSAVEVVHVDRNGHTRCDRFSPKAEQSLMLWGNQGGGGGSFGVVTKFFFADPPPAPSRVCLLSESWNWADFTRDTFTDYCRPTASSSLTTRTPVTPSKACSRCCS